MSQTASVNMNMTSNNDVCEIMMSVKSSGAWQLCLWPTRKKKNPKWNNQEKKLGLGISRIQMWQEEGMVPAQVPFRVKKKKKINQIFFYWEKWCANIIGQKTDHFPNNCGDRQFFSTRTFQSGIMVGTAVAKKAGYSFCLPQSCK